MFLPLLLALIAPADWVPARWPWSDPQTLDLLKDRPVNCLLLKWSDDRASALADFTAQAAARGIVTLAVISPGGDTAGAARKAARAEFNGVVLEGDFSDNIADQVRHALPSSKAILIELTSRARMKLGGNAPIIGTYQGVWPGIQVLENGAAKAGPTGSPWIDTNSGFLRAVRAWGDATVWIGNWPPPKTLITGERYLQAIADAAIIGARWILALDDDFAHRLQEREPNALKDWQRIAEHLKFFEDHKSWRKLKPYSQLAIVQDVNSGALLSGGILDMIAAKHTPVRPIPHQHLTAESLKGIAMTVDVDPTVLTPEQREILKSFTRGGGTLLTGPPGWKDQSQLKGDQITLEKAELERLNDIWHEVQGMIGRRNLGARLFNVSSMLSNLVASADGKEIIVHLVNYSGFPVENVAVHLIGEFKHARLYTPEGGERRLETYKVEEGTGVDIDKVSVCAALQLD